MDLTPMNSAAEPDPIRLPWRVGHSTGRAIYASPGGNDDVVGMMDTRELAAFVVDAANNSAPDANLHARLDRLEKNIDGLEAINTQLRTDLQAALDSNTALHVKLHRLERVEQLAGKLVAAMWYRPSDRQIADVWQSLRRVFQLPTQ